MASPPLLFDALVFVAVQLSIAAANEFTVGDSDGWDTGTNYLAWSEKYNFTVGDVLVFKYVRGQHNVLQVTEETFRSCDTSSGVLEAHADGDDRIALPEPKSYWFVCSVSGHCQGGMRFGINVTIPPEPPTSAPPPPPPKAGAAAGGGGLSWWWWWTIGLLSMGL